MKHLSILVMASVLSGQAIGLTDDERAKVNSEALHHLDAECVVIERKVIDHRQAVRFRCGESTERVYVFDGSIEIEPRGAAAVKAKAKRVGFMVLGAALTILVMYTGMAQR